MTSISRRAEPAAVVLAAVLLAAGSARAMGGPAGDTGPEQAPRQTFLGGEEVLGAELAAMERAADAVIRRLADAPGSPESRYRLGELEIHMAMRPEFGPANAALFGSRHRRLEALARAIGPGAQSAPSDRGRDLDGFAAAVLAARGALESRGFAVESSAGAGPGGWVPATPAWMLQVVDSGRTVSERRPYAGTPAGPPVPPEPKKVHPRLTLLFAVPRRMRGSGSMVRREQPAEPVGALSGAFVFTPDPAQSTDQDDGGRLRAESLAALFPDGGPAAAPEAARNAGARGAVVHNGLLRISTGAPAASAAGLRAPGARTLLWTTTGGPDFSSALSPIE